MARPRKERLLDRDQPEAGDRNRACTALHQDRPGTALLTGDDAAPWATKEVGWAEGEARCPSIRIVGASMGIAALCPSYEPSGAMRNRRAAGGLQAAIDRAARAFPATLLALRRCAPADLVGRSSPTGLLPAAEPRPAFKEVGEPVDSVTYGPRFERQQPHRVHDTTRSTRRQQHRLHKKPHQLPPSRMSMKRFPWLTSLAGLFLSLAAGTGGRAGRGAGRRRQPRAGEPRQARPRPEGRRHPDHAGARPVRGRARAAPGLHDRRRPLLIQGSISDVDKREDLTEPPATRPGLQAVKQVSEDQMVVFGPKDAPGTITVFTDIDCGFCRRLHSEIAKYNANGNPRPLPVHAAHRQGQRVLPQGGELWCAKEPPAGHDRRQGGQGRPRAGLREPGRPAHGPRRADGINGTPALILPDGELLPGYVPPDRLKLILATSRPRPSSAERTGRREPMIEPGSDCLAPLAGAAREPAPAVASRPSRSAAVSNTGGSGTTTRTLSASTPSTAS